MQFITENWGILYDVVMLVLVVVGILVGAGFFVRHKREVKELLYVEQERDNFRRKWSALDARLDQVDPERFITRVTDLRSKSDNKKLDAEAQDYFHRQTEAFGLASEVLAESHIRTGATFGLPAMEEAVRLAQLGMAANPGSKRLNELVKEAQRRLEAARRGEDVDSLPLEGMTEVDLIELSEKLTSDGKYSLAEIAARHSVPLAFARSGPESANFAAALGQLGLTLHALGEYSESEVTLLKALEIVRASTGEKHTNLVYHLNNLAQVMGAQGRHPEAEMFCTEALEISRAEFGEGHSSVSTCLNNLALAIEQQGRYAEAEELYLQAREIDRATIGEQHPGYAAHLANLASVVEAQGRYVEAEGLYRQSLAIGRATIGDKHPTYAVRLNNLAGVVQAQDRYAEAEALYRETLEIDLATIGDTHPDYAVRLNNLAGVVATQGRHEEAEELWEEALNILRRTLGDEHPTTRKVAESFLSLITSFRQASPHRAWVEAFLAQRVEDVSPAKSKKMLIARGGQPSPRPAPLTGPSRIS